MSLINFLLFVRLCDSMSLINLLAICLLQTTYIGCGFYATTLISGFTNDMNLILPNYIAMTLIVICTYRQTINLGSAIIWSRPIQNFLSKIQFTRSYRVQHMILCIKYKKRYNIRKKEDHWRKEEEKTTFDHTYRVILGKKDRLISNNCTENNDTWPPYSLTETLVSYLMNDGIIGLIQWR